jgi:ribonuclease R
MSTKSRKRKTSNDPFADREAQKYEHPVPSREAILAQLARIGRPQSLAELALGLGVEGERDEEAFRRRLRAMERDGQVLENRRGRYGLVAKMDMVRGRVAGHPDGYGFIVPEQGGTDLFVAPRDMRQVLHGDRVLAQVTGTDERGRNQGRIVEVLERQHSTVVGRFFDNGQIAYVAPQDKRISQDIMIPADARGVASDGQIVVAEIIEQPTRSARPVGRVSEVLGAHKAPGMEAEIAVRMHELPHAWPAEVLAEAQALPAEVPEADKAGREDLRDLPLVTIDGEDAQDFDDAVFCEPKARGWRLIVAIAHVSHYVRPGQPLDGEGGVRGNSIYFPDRVIPMLPEKLSNGLCSLNPDVDRLCMACEMSVTQKGNVTRYRFFEGVMRSHARLTYTDAAQILVDGDEALRGRHAHVLPSLQALYDVYGALRIARAARGAVDLDLPETRIVYDDRHRIDRIVPRLRNDAHRLIEECMLAANVCAAAFIAEHRAPSLYRNHEGPDATKVADVRRFLAGLGLSLGGGDTPRAKDYAALVDQVRGRPDADLVQSVLLRSFNQAVYSPDNIGHFALGYSHYTHFTSPIRRYPDLTVHRTIRRLIAGGQVPRDEEAWRHLRQVGEHCSMTERRADEASRDVVSWLKAEYMMDKVGESYDGVITGVTNFGIFVQLKEVFVEGMVHVTALGNDYYHFESDHLRLTGERTGRSFRLGDPVRVRVVRVDLDEAQIDFELEGAEGGAGGPRKARAKKKAGRGESERKRRGPGRKTTADGGQKAGRRRKGRR